jgi:hypothetical protein
MLLTEIKKEQIPDMVFSKKDVLINNNDKKQRQEKLEQAMQLSNTDKQKAKVVFKHAGGFGFVYTTIWYVSDLHIQLKAGVLIPINAILEIIF